MKRFYLYGLTAIGVIVNTIIGVRGNILVPSICFSLLLIAVCTWRLRSLR